MKHLFLLGVILVFLGICFPAIAQDMVTPRAFGEVSAEPECFNIVNKAPYTVFGSVNSNFFIRGDGVKTRHKSNFRLESESYVRFCTSGPFYDGHRMELVLRTIVPIFECKTTVLEDIIIDGYRKEEGGTETKASCR